MGAVPIAVANAPIRTSSSTSSLVASETFLHHRWKSCLRPPWRPSRKRRNCCERRSWKRRICYPPWPGTAPHKKLRRMEVMLLLSNCRGYVSCTLLTVTTPFWVLHTRAPSPLHRRNSLSHSRTLREACTVSAAPRHSPLKSPARRGCGSRRGA